MTSAVLSQSKFRWRQDGGAVDGTPTWGAAITTNWSQPVETNFRIRFLIQNTAAGASSATTVKLQVNRNAGAFQDVTTSSTIAKAVTYSTSADNTAIVTNQLAGTGTYAQGLLSETGAPAGSVTVAASGNTEFEFCVRVNAADVANGDTLVFKVVTVTGSTITATTSPSVTVSEAAVDTKEWWTDLRNDPVIKRVNLRSVGLDLVAAPEPLPPMPGEFAASVKGADSALSAAVRRASVSMAAAQLVLAVAAVFPPPSSISSAMAHAESEPQVINSALVYDPTAAPPALGSGEFLPDFVQWIPHEQPAKIRNAVALADRGSTAAPIVATAAATITSTIAAAFSVQTTIVDAVVVDQTTGPVSPPAAAAATVPFAAVHSESAGTKGRKFIVPLSAFAFAIPVDDFGFDVSELPIRLAPVLRAAIERTPTGPIFIAPAVTPPPVTFTEDFRFPRRARGPVENNPVAPIFVAPTATISTTIAAAYSEQVTLWQSVVYDLTVAPAGAAPAAPATVFPPLGQRDVAVRLQKALVLDRTIAGPVVAPAAAFAAPIILTEDSRGRRRTAPAEAFAAPPNVAVGEFLPNRLPQWLGDLSNGRTARAIKALGAVDIDLQLAFVSTASQPVGAAFVAQWHHQWDWRPLSKPRSQDASVVAPSNVATGEFLPSFVTQWLGDLSNGRGRAAAKAGVDADLQVGIAVRPIGAIVVLPHHHWEWKPLAKPRPSDANVAAPIGATPTQQIVLLSWADLSGGRTVAGIRKPAVAVTEFSFVAPAIGGSGPEPFRLLWRDKERLRLLAREEPRVRTTSRARRRIRVLRLPPR